MPKESKRKAKPSANPGNATGFGKPTLESEAILDAAESGLTPELTEITEAQLLNSANIAIIESYKRARLDNAEATSNLLRIATLATKLLNQLAKKPSPALLLLARKIPLWPFFYSPKGNFLEGYSERLEQLKIGVDCQLNVHPKSKWSFQGTAREWAFNIWHAVQDFKTQVQARRNAGVQFQLSALETEMVNLPPLNKSNAKLWMKKVGRSLLLDWTNGVPETNPALLPLGLSRAKRGLNKHGEPYDANSRTVASNIRDGIFKAIEGALRDMVVKADFPPS